METNNHMPVLQLLAKINSGGISVKTLSPRDRQNMVEHLLTQGSSVAEMAMMLKVSDRTIVRDRQEIRGRNAVYSDEVGFMPRILGMMVQHLEDSLGRLHAIQFSVGSTARDRMMAERSMAYVFATFIKRFQSLGYMPRFPQRDSQVSRAAAQSQLEAAKNQLSQDEAQAMRKRIKQIERSRQFSGSLELDTVVQQSLAEDFSLQSSRANEWEARAGISRRDRRRLEKIERRVQASMKRA